MGMILLRMVMAVYLGWICWNPAGDMGYDRPAADRQEPEYGVQDFGYSGEPDSSSQVRTRGLFSAYVVGGVDCMDDGSYEAYVQSLADNPGEGSRHEEQAGTEEFPKIYLRFMGLDLTDYIEGSGTERQFAYHKAFCSDVFYMEYPSDWYVGSTDASPLTFVPEWEEEASGQVFHDWAEYFDDNLRGSTRQVGTYIEGGGINGCLEEVMGKPVTEDYTWELREDDSEWLLIYDLKKGEKEAAEVIVWCNLGKFNVRRRDMELTVKPEADYGRILVFREWDTFDFSSEAAIREYAESGDFLYRLLGKALEEDVENQILSLAPGTYTTPYHVFFALEIGLREKDRPEQLLRQAWVYIPVTRPGQSNWVVVFEAFPGSRQEEGVSSRKIRQQVMNTFVVLPCYHQVQKGENLSVIAGRYGEDPDLAYEIAAYAPNQIHDPDRIWPGQQIEIPLGVLFKRVRHGF